MDCFWNNWYPSNEIWCEEKKCSIIVNPINTFSNIFYLIIGSYIYEYNKKIGLSTMLIGITSSMYHLSDTMFFRILDLYSINILYSILLSNVLYRKNIIEDKKGCTIILSLYSSFLFISPLCIEMYLYYYYFIFLTLFIYYYELSFYFFNELIYTSMFLLIIGFIFSMLDKKSILCEKDSYFQGHSFWHFLSSLSIYFISIPQSVW